MTHVLIACFLSSAFADQPLIASGVYEDGGIVVTVNPSSRVSEHGDRWVKIEAEGRRDGRPHFARVFVDARGMSACIGHSREGVTRAADLEPNNMGLMMAEYGMKAIRLRWFRGSLFGPSETFVELSADRRSGALTRLAVVSRVARWRWAKGWHSGPLKVQRARFDCANLILREPVDRAG